MKIIAYIYTNPLLETAPSPNIWGWDIDKIYQDLGERTQLNQLLIDCVHEPANYLLIRRLEELGDSVDEIYAYLTQLEELGIIVISMEQSTNKDDNIKANLLQLVQQIQREKRSEKVSQIHAQNRLKFAPPPGQVPYGYKRGKDTYLLDKKTAPIVKEFFAQFLLFGSLRGAVKYIDKKYNKRISVTTGKRWLINHVYRGDTAYFNNQIISDTHVPIISREESAQIDRFLRLNKRLPKRSASAPRSLAGLVICNQCKTQMTITRVTRKNHVKEYLYLRPINCQNKPKCKTMCYDDVLQEIITKICVELPQAVGNIKYPSGDIIKQNITEAIAQKQQILIKLPNLIDDGILDTETAELRAYKIRTEISQLQAKLSQLPPENLLSIVQAVSIPRFWLDLSETERRFYLREFIRNIEVSQVDGHLQVIINFIFN